MQKVLEWLARNVIALGVLSVLLDLATRFFQQVAIDWITDVSAGYDLNFAQLRSIDYVKTLLDMSAALVWGCFSIGFVQRVILEIRALKAGK